MNELFAAIATWRPNRWLMFGGFAGTFFFGSTGIAGFHPNPTLAISGMGISGIMIVLGAWYAREALRFGAMERRSETRPSVPVSRLSIAYARQLHAPLTMAEIDAIPPLAVDKAKTKPQLLDALCRLRLREAAGEGEVVYYREGQYRPRDDNVTVLADGA